jgi:hypothetical protein
MAVREPDPEWRRELASEMLELIGDVRQGPERSDDARRLERLQEEGDS